MDTTKLSWFHTHASASERKMMQSTKWTSKLQPNGAFFGKASPALRNPNKGPASPAEPGTPDLPSAVAIWKTGIPVIYERFTVHISVDIHCHTNLPCKFATQFDLNIEADCIDLEPQSFGSNRYPTVVAFPLLFTGTITR